MVYILYSPKFVVGHIRRYHLHIIYTVYTTSLGSPAKIRAPSHKSHKSSTDGWFYMFNMFPIYIYINIYMYIYICIYI